MVYSDDLCTCDVSAAIGQMYCNGHGCEVDKPHGVKWLKEASNRGCMYATGLLSCEYFTSKLYSRAVEYASKYENLLDLI